MEKRMENKQRITAISKSIRTHVHARGKHHRGVVNCTTRHSRIAELRAKVVEDVASHQSQLRHLGEDNSESGEVTADEPIIAIQLAPAAHPEEEVQQLRDEHREHEVRGEGLDLARLHMAPFPSSYTVLLKHVQLGENGHTLQIHGDGPGHIHPSLAAALRVNDLWSRGREIRTRAQMMEGRISSSAVYSLRMYCWPQVS